jgi:D-amino-acid oxidase
VRVIVVGAGVIGLSCAVRLAEAGFEVHVQARDLPLETTSSVAAALWYPYRAYPRDAVDRWGRATYGELVRLAAEEPTSGVRVRWGTELLRRTSADPWWAATLPTLDRVPASRLPDGYADGWRFPSPLVDMPVYLSWLTRRLAAAGGTVTRMSLPTLPGAPLVVNCTGVAARALAGDPSVQPVRGQVVLVEQVGIEEWLLDGDESAMTYVVPRERTVVVGGTAVEGDWDREPDAGTAELLLQRARALEPRLRTARVVGHRVGLRPGRPAVRLETERRPDGAVVHCYGHGGAGVTLSWGCADDVLAEVARVTAALF